VDVSLIQKVILVYWLSVGYRVGKVCRDFVNGWKFLMYIKGLFSASSALALLLSWLF